MNLKGMNILITGGTGSFGTAFCEYIIKTNNIPNKLVIFSRDWLKQQNLKDRLRNPDFVAWRIGDIRDRDRLKRAFDDIDIVIHAAAIKEIVTCEKHIKETIMTNVDGTQNVLDACIDCGVKKALLISTDKACKPINAYGISKAAAEKIFIQGNAYAGGKDIKFSVCRYGNVIGSNGSVVKIFKQLIDEGAKELPVTDERMTRFFYPMDDAIRFVLNSLDIMQGGETFIPKIKSIGITDLCKAFDMPYKVIGIRPGEKLHEEMVPAEMFHLTLEQGLYYLIIPTVEYNLNANYKDEKRYGIQLPVKDGFSYNSLDNEYMSIEEIRKHIGG